MTQELNSPALELTDIVLPERSLRYLSSVVGKLPPMATAPAAWFFSMDNEVLAGYEKYRVAKKSWDDRMAELLELTGCKKYYAGPGHLMGLSPPSLTAEPPRWWRATKKGHWVPRVRTKAEKESDANKRFKAAHDIPWPVDFLPGIPKDLWTADAIYPVHVRKPGQAVLVFLGADPDKGDPPFEVDNRWSRLKMSMFHSLLEYQATWLPKDQ
jgi:hypothetical protein